MWMVITESYIPPLRKSKIFFEADRWGAAMDLPTTGI
jgi:hypothetical protein